MNICRHLSFKLYMFAILFVFCSLSYAEKNTDQSNSPSVAINQLTILLYHHIDTETPAATSTTPEQFEQHLEYLHHNGFQVLDLAEALEKIKNGVALPDKSVAITFDDGYESIFNHAWPLLKQYKMPFTVFISTEPIDKKYASMMNWQQIKTLHDNRVTIANHTQTHAHLLGLDRQAARREIDLSQNRLKTMLKSNTKLFAYPYGEYGLGIAHYLKENQYWALTQFSGPASQFSSAQALPRFSMSGSYASMKQFELKVNSLAMPVTDQNSYDPVHSKPNREYQLNFSTLPFQPSQFNCFFNGEAIKNIKWSEKSVAITLSVNPPEGRSRINCTAPDKYSSRYYWHSLPIFTQPASGTWPD